MRTPTFGFPTRYRLTHPRQYRNVLGRAAYRDQSGPLRILANPNTMPSARLGLIIGKRAVAKAHERNRLKRVAREAFRLKRSELPALDIVLQVQGPIDSCTLRSKLEDMLNLIEEKLV